VKAWLDLSLRAKRSNLELIGTLDFYLNPKLFCQILPFVKAWLDLSLRAKRSNLELI